ncbi:hypothetical protein FFLO_05411 [Filobasidium floriforme]|uniref:Sensitive to high expression protein 9, mitochondrial n=1 Tax=Filobasidium floriforme TaxID=5210 RepID=A0A8K0NRD5_9TREE|nr:Mdm33 family-domain-containing protein [Filobasidium floriforme]KAG7529771.1 hypothetical protein FFLO_05411 [Filobasidium floriforme]KAH8079342.1 Mdm33 family-domain-containing protein [Filobasidium floriforme]
MFKSVTIRSISRKRDLPSAWLPTTQYRHRNALDFDRVRMFSNTPERRAQPDTLDKHDEDVQRILREYGVDPDDVGDAKLEEKKKKKKRERKVEDFEAWKEWDGMVDRKEEKRLEGVVGPGVDTGMGGKIGQDGTGKEEGTSGPSTTSTSNLTTSSGSAPLLIRPLPTSPTSNATSSSSSSSSTAGLTRPQAEKLQARLNDHIKTLRTEADALRKTLSVRTEVLRQRASERAKALEQEARVQFGLLGGRVNELTGYNEVERLKREVTEREDDISRLRTIAREAKLAYDEAVNTRTESQREVNSLLERKHAWSDSDVIKFTSLVRADHLSNASVQTTKTALVQAEADVEKAFDGLMKSILHRYHEEQVWSDKIRSVSTYGSLIVLVVNLVVFLGAIAVVEPWKRRRLVKGLEERVKGMMETVEGKVEHEMGAVKEMLHGVHTALAALSTGDGGQMSEALAIPAAQLADTEIVETEAPGQNLREANLALDVPETAGIVPRSFVYTISEQVARVSPRSSDYLLHLDHRKIETAVVGTAGILLGAGCMGLIAWLR